MTGQGTLFHKGLKGIIFDCDGVMIDSIDANRRFYNLVLSHLGLSSMTAAQEAYAFQATAAQALRSMLPEKWHDKLDELVSSSLDYNRDVLPYIKLMPGFTEFIQIAHNKGLRMAIDTNRTDYGIQRVLDFFSLPPYFDPIVASSDVEPKPSPAGALKICANWAVPPSRVLFIGDSADDRKAAQGAGCAFAAFRKSQPGSDLEITSFSSLEKILWPGLEQPDLTPEQA